MKYIKGFIAGVLTVFVGIFLMVRWAWKRTNMTEDYVIPRVKDSIVGFVVRLFYGNDYEVHRRQRPHYYPSYVHYNTIASPLDSLRFPNKRAADEKLEHLLHEIETYRVVAASEAYDDDSFVPDECHDYGWTDLSNAWVKKCYGGWKIAGTPKPEKLLRYRRY